MLTQIISGAVQGIQGTLINVEIDLSNGFPGWIIVGLPDATVRESKERIRAAFKNSNLEFPSTHRITVNLAPADIPKEGSSFDVPLAVGLMCAKYHLEFDTSSSLFLGEVALDGSIRPVPGVLPVARAAGRAGVKSLYVPLGNVAEAALVPDITVYPLRTLAELYTHLAKKTALTPHHATATIASPPLSSGCDFSLIQGQAFAKRAFEIAAAGGHNILLSGPPGAGKTLLARALPTILPPLSREEALEVTELYSVAGSAGHNPGLLGVRPFRNPHHTSSAIALTGGGRVPRPGEISLSHHGVLFLDEFPEFPRSVLEILRQPLEDGEITVSRAQGSCTFPARFMLVASQNPCPCGFAGDEEKPCTCSAMMQRGYEKKISGPLLDRIDMIVEVRRVPYEDLTATTPTGDSSETIRQRVSLAREKSRVRLYGTSATTNAAMGVAELKKYCAIDTASHKLLHDATKEYHLSPRALHRILKVSRTIADLAGEKHISLPHVAEALHYRSKKKNAP